MMRSIFTEELCGNSFTFYDAGVWANVSGFLRRILGGWESRYFDLFP